jgi:hypothetical protein
MPDAEPKPVIGGLSADHRLKSASRLTSAGISLGPFNSVGSSLISLPSFDPKVDISPLYCPVKHSVSGLWVFVHFWNVIFFI